MKLRLKSKRVLADDGTHETRFGTVNRKYWFTPDEVTSVLDRRVNDTQAELLDDDARRTFESRAGDILCRLNYT